MDSHQVHCTTSISRFPGSSRSIWSVLSGLRPRSPRIHIPHYVWCTIGTSLGGFLWGFDTGSIGPITIMPHFQAKFGDKATGVISPTVQGLIVSCILITASLSSILSGQLSDRISRIRTISLGGVVFAIGSAIGCSAESLAQMFVGRCLAGVGQGLFLSAITVYAVEIAPASSRGRLGNIVQLFIASGIAIGQSTGTNHFST